MTPGQDAATKASPYLSGEEVCAHGYYRCACAGIAVPKYHHNSDYKPPIGRHDPCDDPLPSTVWETYG